MPRRRGKTKDKLKIKLSCNSNLLTWFIKFFVDAAAQIVKTATLLINSAISKSVEFPTLKPSWSSTLKKILVRRRTIRFFTGKPDSTAPCLAEMARNYLAAPSTSTPAELAFSQGRLLIHYTRSRLTAEDIRALLCLKSWQQINI